MTAEVFWDITPKNYVFLGFLCGEVFVVVLGEGEVGGCECSLTRRFVFMILSA